MTCPGHRRRRHSLTNPSQKTVGAGTEVITKEGKQGERGCWGREGDKREEGSQVLNVLFTTGEQAVYTEGEWFSHGVSPSLSRAVHVRLQACRHLDWGIGGQILTDMHGDRRALGGVGCGGDSHAESG